VELSRAEFGVAFEALSDVVQAIEAADTHGLELSAGEIHSICYFSRILSYSLYSEANSVLAYEFSFGANGGPFSLDIRSALMTLVSQGMLLTVSPTKPSGDRNNYRLTQSGREAVSLLYYENVERSVNSFIKATVGAMGLRSIPWVINAIHREPSLASARRQRLRTGVPLSQSEEFSEWLREVRAILCEHSAVAEIDAAFLVPVVIDILGGSD
jgi:hypothetical protein